MRDKIFTLTDAEKSEAAEEFGDWIIEFSRCPVCGDAIDYCQGHGSIGDPVGAAILEAHDDGDHSQCVIDCEGGE